MSYGLAALGILLACGLAIWWVWHDEDRWP